MGIKQDTTRETSWLTIETSTREPKRCIVAVVGHGNTTTIIIIK